MTAERAVEVVEVQEAGCGRDQQRHRPGYRTGPSGGLAVAPGPQERRVLSRHGVRRHADGTLATIRRFRPVLNMTMV